MSGSLRDCYWCGGQTSLPAVARNMGVERYFCADAVTDSCWNQLRAAVTAGTHTAMGDPVPSPEHARPLPPHERVPYSPRGRS